MLLVVGAPYQLRSPAGQEHGRTIPLADSPDRKLTQCERLFDHVVGAAEHSRWNRKPQCLGGLEIDYQLEFCGLLDWQVGRLAALQDFCTKAAPSRNESGPSTP